MTVQSNLSAVEFASNPDPRCPCVLLLDVSGSMNGQPGSPNRKPIDASQVIEFAGRNPSAGVDGFFDCSVGLSEKSLKPNGIDHFCIAVFIVREATMVDAFGPRSVNQRSGYVGGQRRVDSAIVRAPRLDAAPAIVVNEMKDNPSRIFEPP